MLVAIEIISASFSCAPHTGQAEPPLHNGGGFKQVTQFLDSHFMATIFVVISFLYLFIVLSVSCFCLTTIALY